MMIEKPQTPREYCSSCHALPFGTRTIKSGVPTWRKVGRGLMVVTDGSEQNLVASGLLFGVELDDTGNPAIAAYWRNDREGIALNSPHTVATIKYLIAKGKISRLRYPLKYADMARAIWDVFPEAWIPSPAAFYAEYGLEYDEDTGEINNPRNLK